MLGAFPRCDVCGETKLLASGTNSVWFCDGCEQSDRTIPAGAFSRCPVCGGVEVWDGRVWFCDECRHESSGSEGEAGPEPAA